MSKYTTGEVAKLCGVTVRTVQYYDARGILVPSEVSEGGRRLYSQKDVERLRIICFLRDAGISIGSIAQLFAEAEPGRVIGVLIDEQAQGLEKEMRACQEKLDRLAYLRRALRQAGKLLRGIHRRHSDHHGKSSENTPAAPDDAAHRAALQSGRMRPDRVGGAYRALVAPGAVPNVHGSLRRLDLPVLFPENRLHLSPMPSHFPAHPEGSRLGPAHPRPAKVHLYPVRL